MRMFHTRKLNQTVVRMCIVIDFFLLREEKKHVQNQKSKQKILYIDAKSGNPEKMEIKDNNKNIAVYILYKEVSVNS